MLRRKDRRKVNIIKCDIRKKEILIDERRSILLSTIHFPFGDPLQQSTILYKKKAPRSGRL
jgi:hypothetical protein